jgi:GNAT superfamily N-acetyltransferase
MNDLKHIDPDRLWDVTGRAMVATLSRAPGLVTHAVPGAWWVTSDVNSWMANWLACYRADPAALDVFQAGLDHAVASGRTTSVVVSEVVRDLLAPLTAGRPMDTEGTNSMMWRDARPLPPNPRPYPGDVTRVEAGADLTNVFGSVSRAFELDQAAVNMAMAGMLNDPAMQMFTASSDALDSLCLMYSDADLTYIHVMATDPDRQRRGAGRAVMVRAMENAIQDGATGFSLLASHAGEHLYRALGYETWDQVGFWVVNPTPET